MAALIWSPFADEDSAGEAGRLMVEEGLAGCANIVAPIRSVFLWQGAVSEARECGVLFKTDKALLARAVARLEQIHPYETPAIMAWPCDASPPVTAAWLAGLGGLADGAA